MAKPGGSYELAQLNQNQALQQALLNFSFFCLDNGVHLTLLPGVFDEMLGEERSEIDPKLVSVLQALAERHVQYQTKAKHYVPVGLAIITTFEKMLGDQFDDNTKTAWVELWSLICSVMIPAHVKQAQRMGVEI